MKRCTVEGCLRKHVAKGYCSSHYNRANYTPEQLTPRSSRHAMYAARWSSTRHQQRAPDDLFETCRRTLDLGRPAKPKPLTAAAAAFFRDMRSPLLDVRLRMATTPVSSETCSANVRVSEQAAGTGSE